MVEAIARPYRYLSLVVEAIVWADFSDRPRADRDRFAAETVLAPMMLSVARTRDLCKMVLVVAAAGSGKVTLELTVAGLQQMTILTGCLSPSMTVAVSLPTDRWIALLVAVADKVLADDPVVQLLTPADLPLLLSAALLPSQKSSVAPPPIVRGLRAILGLLSKELSWVTSGQNLINNS